MPAPQATATATAFDSKSCTSCSTTSAAPCRPRAPRAPQTSEASLLSAGSIVSARAWNSACREAIYMRSSSGVAWEAHLRPRECPALSRQPFGCEREKRVRWPPPSGCCAGPSRAPIRTRRPRKWRGMLTTGGSMFSRMPRINSRCSLPLLALSSACRCLNTLGERLSGRAASGRCASNRARPLESRISP